MNKIKLFKIKDEKSITAFDHHWSLEPFHCYGQRVEEYEFFLPEKYSDYHYNSLISDSDLFLTDGKGALAMITTSACGNPAIEGLIMMAVN